MTQRRPVCAKTYGLHAIMLRMYSLWLLTGQQISLRLYIVSHSVQKVVVTRFLFPPQIMTQVYVVQQAWRHTGLQGISIYEYDDSEGHSFHSHWLFNFLRFVPAFVCRSHVFSFPLSLSFSLPTSFFPSFNHALLHFLTSHRVVWMRATCLSILCVCFITKSYLSSGIWPLDYPSFDLSCTVLYTVQSNVVATAGYLYN